ncbi:MAG: FG-GAP-like repeat-containing protein [Planctomycetota bacterium]|nr:FG-GAP-like repeat-containing protein [Planctomycetota bacterium]
MRVARPLSLVRLLSLGFGLGCVTAVASAQCGPFFANPSVALTLQNIPRDLIAADLNRDRIPDLICTTTSNFESRGINVMRTSVSGVPEVRQFLPISGNQPTIKVAVADVNRDGIVDLLATGYTTGSLLVYLGIGDGTFNPSPAAFSTGTSPAAFTVSDLNNDGRPDVVVVNATDSTFSVLMGNGDGTFQPRIVTAAGISSPNLLALADMNGDGRLDLIMSGSGAFLTVRLGNGNGTFASGTVIQSSFTSLGVSKFVATDVTGDGVPDVLSTNTANDRIYLFKGRGNGTLEPDVQINVALTDTRLRVFDVADFNGDGMPDLALLYADPSGVASFPAVALGDGKGAFASPIKWPNSDLPGSSFALAIADLNSDTRPDIIYVDGFGKLISTLSSSAGIKLLWGQGNIVYPAGWNVGVSVYAEGTGLSYQWFKNGEPLVSTGRVWSDGRFLQFNNLNDSDSGVYQCRISNACSSVMTTSYVHVLPASNPCSADFNGDGFITFEDFDAFIAAFEQGC